MHAVAWLVNRRHTIMCKQAKFPALRKRYRIGVDCRFTRVTLLHIRFVFFYVLLKTVEGGNGFNLHRHYAFNFVAKK